MMRQMALEAVLILSVLAAAPIGDGVTLAIAGRSNANPSIAASGRLVVVVWAAAQSEGGTDLYAAVSRDGGHSFAQPVRVNDGGGDVRLSGEQPPRIALVPAAGRDPSIVIVWTAKGVDGTRLLTARSDDGGATFAKASTVPGSVASGNRGWEAVAADASGRVSVLWLDHRDASKPASSGTSMTHDGQQHTGHAMPNDGVAHAQLSKLYFTQLDSAAATSITGGVCYCCKTALAAAPDGALYAAWRHVYAGNIRDIAFTVSRDAGRTFAPPIRVSEDRWALDGCPENGPAIAVDARRRVHVVWPTLDQSSGSDSPTLALFYAATTGDGHFSARQRIPTEGVPRHPQLTVDRNGSMAIAWDEQADTSRRVVVTGARVDHDLLQLGQRAVVSSERGEYPSLASTDEGFVVAWTSGASPSSVIRIEQITPARGGSR